jgi:NAD(P)-dependent dehydrogenase (short-subunit alcohol dehydrogenase family)
MTFVSSCVKSRYTLTLGEPLRSPARYELSETVRAGQPSEVTPCFVFLTSDDASYMTGQFLHSNEAVSSTGRSKTSAAMI